MNEALIALIIQLAARDTQVDPNLLAAVIEVESGSNPNAYNPRDGHSASYGLGQLKLLTARECYYSGDASGLYDPYLGALYAGRYLSKQYRRYKNTCKAVSAYNAGSYHMAPDGKPKNLKYVKKVFDEYNRRSGTRSLQISLCDGYAHRNRH